ncbi:LOW QUALITY PROTEIN: protein phosphatase 1M [Pluvialis apricaria]
MYRYVIKPLIPDKKTFLQEIKGYPEKSEFNEDQAACCQISIRRREPGLEEDKEWLILCSTQLSSLPLPPPRAILVLKDNIAPMSCKFSEAERQRIQHLAFLFPKLLDGEFTHFEFPQRLKGDDMGQKVLYQDYFMEGWGDKTVEKADLKYLLVHGHGKQACLLGTLAVSRGLGDHHLKVIDTNIEVKPFLSSPKSVNVFDFALHDIKEDDVLIMATDGLWDVLSNKEVAHMVRSFLAENRMDPHRFSELAKCLVCRARGKERGHQMLDDSHDALNDDISVFVIPLHNRDED